MTPREIIQRIRTAFPSTHADEAKTAMEKREQPITDFNVEGHLFLDRYEQAAQLEKQAIWLAARTRCAEIDKSVADAKAAVKPAIGRPSLITEIAEPDVGRMRKALQRLAVVARTDFRGDRLQKALEEAGAAEPAPEQTAA